jgi:hypothetical protein
MEEVVVMVVLDFVILICRLRVALIPVLCHSSPLVEEEAESHLIVVVTVLDYSSAAAVVVFETVSNLLAVAVAVAVVLAHSLAYPVPLPPSK